MTFKDTDRDGVCRICKTKMESTCNGYFCQKCERFIVLDEGNPNDVELKDIYLKLVRLEKLITPSFIWRA